MARNMPPPPLPGNDGHGQQPPPSTMTDAIFKNLSKDQASTQLSNNKSQFQQLLTEMLAGGSQTTNGEDTIMTEGEPSKSSGTPLRIWDPKLNFKIIQVMVNAGLTALVSDDPFRTVDKLLVQAEGSLVIIRRSIQQSPEVLILDPLTQLKDSNSIPEDNMQLYLWLLPRLMPLLGNSKLEALQEGVRLILAQMLLELIQTPAGWIPNIILTLYLHDCVSTIMDVFRDDIKLTLKSKFSVELPSAEFVPQLSMQDIVHLPSQPLYFVITNSSQAALIVLHIFSIFTKVMKDPYIFPSKRHINDEFLWIMESLSEMLSFMETWDSFPVTSQNTMTIRRCMLDALISAIETKTEYRDELCLLAMRCGSQILDRPVAEIDQTAEMSVATLSLLVLSVAHTESLTELHLASTFLPAVRRTMLDEYTWNILHRDLKVSLLRVLHLAADGDDIQEQVSAHLNEVSEGMWTYQNERLVTMDADLGIPVFVDVDTDMDADIITSGGNSKRRKIAHHSSQDIDLAGDLIQKVFRALGGQDVRDLEGLSKVALGGFDKLSVNDRCDVLVNLGNLPCVITAQATLDSAKGAHLYCKICDGNEAPNSDAIPMSELQDREVLQTLDLLRTHESLSKEPRIRFRAMQALKRMLKHVRGTGSILYTTKLGSWCLHTLHCSSREARIAAAFTLPCFPCFSSKYEGLHKERFQCVKYLRDLSDQEEAVVQETCVLAWSHLADLLEDDELGVALHRLIEYLGNASPFIVGVAYNEIKRVAGAKKMTARRLLTPFWKDLSVNIVKQLKSKPQIIRMVSELCSHPIDYFLTLTIGYTFKYMVLMKKVDVIERMVLAWNATRAEQVTFNKLILEFLPSTLALLFVQDNCDEKAICRIIGDVCPSLETNDIGTLFKFDSIHVASEILKVCGGDETKRKRACGKNAIKLVAQHDQKKFSASAKKDKDYILPLFIERTALGIMASLNATTANLSDIEKIPAVQAIQELIILGHKALSSALPQICASLQTFMSNDTLRTPAWSAWTALIEQRVREADTTPLIGLSFALIRKYWNMFSSQAKEITSGRLLLCLFENGSAVLAPIINELPSLAPINSLAEYEEKTFKWRIMAEKAISDQPDKLKREQLRHLTQRCLSENFIIVEIALIELAKFLQEEQQYIQDTAGNEIPDAVISSIIRVLLDITARSHDRPDITTLCASCLGLVGAVDTNRIDIQRPSADFILVENFANTEESINFVLYVLEKRVVKAFLAASDSKVQDFLALTMQELLKFCNFDDNVLIRSNANSISNDKQYRWNALSDIAQTTLTPFLTSKYFMSWKNESEVSETYPIFDPSLNYRQWITRLLLDLYNKACGQRAKNFFQLCSRIVKGQDVALLNFMLPYIVLNIIVSGTSEQRGEICKELLAILEYKADPANRFLVETLKLCSETVFVLVDYLTRWVFEKKKSNAVHRAQLARQHNRHAADDHEGPGDVAVANVEKVLSQLPPKLMGERSVECQSYARALFYWEQHIRRIRDDANEAAKAGYYSQLQTMYAQIDEPDGLEGISTKLHALDLDQQLLEHKKAGRWMAVQSWYEHLLVDKPDDMKLQLGLLTSLKQSGQYESLLHFIDGVNPTSNFMIARSSAFAVEAAWMSSKWNELDHYLQRCPQDLSGDLLFDVNIGQAIAAFRKKNIGQIPAIVANTRVEIAKSLTYSSTTSIRQCRDQLFKLHALTEVEDMVAHLESDISTVKTLRASLDGRLKLIGPSIKEKQYLLALRRAFFTVSCIAKEPITRDALSTSWLLSSKLARKSGDYHQAFNAILSASDLGDQLAPVEQARLYWTEGRHRKAVKTLHSVIIADKWNVQSFTEYGTSMTSLEGGPQPQSYAKARAILLYAKWLDNSGQKQSKEVVELYRKASAACTKWEKGHYYLGRHYNKLLETEERLPPNKRTRNYIAGDTVKLVCQNYMRALAYGTKYIFQTLPRTLTLWLDLGAQVEEPLDPKYASGEEYRQSITKDRLKHLDALNVTAKKYCLQRVPPYIYLAAFPQIMSRICHPNDKVWAILQALIVRVIVAFPQHGLWSLMAAYKSTQPDRKVRGLKILEKLKENAKMPGQNDIRDLISKSQRLVVELLNMCNAEVKGKPSRVNLQEDLRFRHDVAPIGLMMPTQATMTVSFPPNNVSPSRNHNPFAREQATIHRFDEEAEVMNSLQKPRRIVIYGSDGKAYPFLCKPKDDLRKDARLMEFNTIINRLLKKDVEASKRQLLIKTYAVTPLNEECGLIEWVNNVRPLRDILLKSYRTKGVSINYSNVKLILDDICNGGLERLGQFEKTLLPMFPPVFHEWFVERFAEPATWMAARLAYARSSAVMSMVGYVLGLGDRHGENILYDETNGETLHVDFNCLFDKGLTFEKPERVPFRLTQNMVDALGVTGYEGPFRLSSEVVMRILRENQDSLMTVLETFLHDPLVEWTNTKRRNNKTPAKAPDNPEDVLETIQNKIRGLHAGDPVALSVEGQVNELIEAAVNPANLAAMYIGWCAFF